MAFQEREVSQAGGAVGFDRAGAGAALVRQRDQLLQWAERKGPDAIRAYREERNRASIDRLPGWRGSAR